MLFSKLVVHLNVLLSFKNIVACSGRRFTTFIYGLIRTEAAVGGTKCPIHSTCLSYNQIVQITAVQIDVGNGMGSNAEYHPDLSPLSWIFGVWESVEAEVCYPTIATLQYKEIVEFQPSSTPVIDYKSDTWLPQNNKKMHSERGFLRIDPKSQKVGLVLSHHYGITELSEGSIEKETLSLESQSISEMSFNEVVATKKIVRKWFMVEDVLHFTVFLQTANQPLQLHLKCHYKRKN